jgi:adenine-specific DNA methylase
VKIGDIIMAIPENCKRLAEVDFPLVAVSSAGHREKNIHTGSFSSVHVWWARRPLAACRAMNLACILPDPADENCPVDLLSEIARILDEFQRNLGSRKIMHLENAWDSDDDGDMKSNRNQRMELRVRLLKFIGEYSSWDNKSNQIYTRCARELVTSCHESVPVILDSFAGGGSIPLEGKRIGMKAIATDINPIPLLLNKLQLQQLSDFTEITSANLMSIAEKMNSNMRGRVEKLYPDNSYRRIGELPIGYICAREVVCEGSGCGVKYPLLKSPWVVNSKKGQKVCYNFKLNGGKVNISLIENPSDNQIPRVTVSNANGICPICNHKTPKESIRRQLKLRNGGTWDSRLLVTVTKPIGGKGKRFHASTQVEIDARAKASQLIEKLVSVDKTLSLPDEMLPIPEGKKMGTLGVGVQGYGIDKWKYLFSPRQLLTSLILVQEARKISDSFEQLISGLAVSKFNNQNSSISYWRPRDMKFNRAFDSHRIPMRWDFFEPIPYGEDGSNFKETFINILRGLNSAMVPEGSTKGMSIYSDAASLSLPDDSIDMWATDPPYYDMVPYSDISNFFVVWLKRIGFDLVLENGISPKSVEIVADKSAIMGTDAKNKQWFESRITEALKEGLRVTKKSGIAYWVYAHKSTEGWAATLNGIIDAGWMITGSWPITTDLDVRLRAQRSASLKTSIHIVMRHRPAENVTGDWSDVLDNLTKNIANWLQKMNEAGVKGADSIYSCIGPAMEIFSKYDRIERASGEKVSVETYLDVVWDTIAEEALKLLAPNSNQSATEPDSRFSMMMIWTLRQSTDIANDRINDLKKDKDKSEGKPTKFEIPFDTASLLARGVGVELEDLVKSRVITSSQGTVTLCSPESRRSYLFDTTVGKTITSTNDENIQLKIGESLSDGKARMAKETKTRIVEKMMRKGSHLDMLHQAMLLHADGNSIALEEHLRSTIGDNAEVWQLAQTLNSIYPKGSWDLIKIEGVIARYRSLR